MNALALYLVAAQVAWHPHAGPGELRAGETIAEATADAARELHKTPREALERFAIAWEESGAVWGRIVRGECHKDECDGGAAYGPWQLHVEGGGLVLLPDGWTTARAKGAAWVALHPLEVLTGERLSADPLNGARVAFRFRVAQWTRGRAGLERARRYWSAHPYAP